MNLFKSPSDWTLYCFREEEISMKYFLLIILTSLQFHLNAFALDYTMTVKSPEGESKVYPILQGGEATKIVFGKTGWLCTVQPDKKDPKLSLDTISALLVCGPDRDHLSAQKKVCFDLSTAIAPNLGYRSGKLLGKIQDTNTNFMFAGGTQQWILDFKCTL